MAPRIHHPSTPGWPTGRSIVSGLSPSLAKVSADEASLVAVFLRRYVTYCARRGRLEEAMEGAVDLLRAMQSIAAKAQ